jgi:hypothetical protein
MAQLGVAGAGAVVGAVAGSFVGMPMLGAQIGWAIGGVAGQLLFPTKLPDQQGPRLNDLSVQTSGYGVPIPIVAARSKIAGNVIWKTDLRETATRRRVGGKGGPTQRVTEYSYSMSWATGLCEWLIPPTSAEVLRIWMDARLVYDVTGTSEVSQVPGLTWRFYPGSETQLPDALIEATMGAGEAPAHRGLAYIVFEDVPLETFGNRMPNITVELVADSARSFPQVNSQPPASPLFATDPGSVNWSNDSLNNVAIDYARGRIYEARIAPGATDLASEALIRVYDLITLQSLGEYSWYEVIQNQFPEPTDPATLNTHGLSPGLLHLGQDGFLYAAGGYQANAGCVKIDPDSMRAVGSYGNIFGGGNGSAGSQLRTTIRVAQNLSTVQVDRPGDTPRTYLVISGQFVGALTLDTEDMSYIWGALEAATQSPAAPSHNTGVLPLSLTTQLLPGQRRSMLDKNPGADMWWIKASDIGTPYRLDLTRIEYTSGAASLGADNAMGIKTETFTIDLATEVDASVARAVLQGCWFDESDNSLVLTIAGGGSPIPSWSRFSTFKWQPGVGVVWSVVDHALASGHDARGSISRVFGGRWGLGGNFLIQPRTGDVVVNASGADFHNLFWIDEQVAVIGYRTSGIGAREIGRRRLDIVAPSALTVGDIVEALCDRAGLDPALVNASGLTDTIRGYTLPRPLSARDAIIPLAAAYQFDAVEQDDVLLFRKRGGAPVATIPYAELVREAPDATIVEETRAQDQDLPREITVRFADIDRGWEQNAQSWRRPLSPTATVASRVSASFDLPIPLAATEAKTIAKRMTVATWRERTQITFSVGPRHARLVPTDVITVGTRDGASIRCRVLSVSDGANWTRRIEAVTEDAAAYTLTATDADGGSDWAEPVIPAPYFARLIVPDLALVQDADAADGALREYGFVGAYNEATFRPVEIFRSADAAVWDRLGAQVRAATWGSVTAAPAAPASPWVWDDVNTIDVSLTTGDLDSATDLEVLNGTNAAALVGADGQAEIIQFATVTPLGGNAYRLSRLLRGRRGTEDQAARRAVGDAFVMLDADAAFRFEALPSEAAATRFHRSVTAYETVETARATVTKTARGRAEKPYAPAQIAGARDGSQNLTVTWVRRTRIGGEWLDGTGTVPLSEASEAYEVEIPLTAPAAWAPRYSASTVFSAATLAEFAFNGSAAGLWAASTTSGWLRVDYAVPVTVARYRITAREDVNAVNTPKDWTFEGWNGASWVVLDTRTAETGWALGEQRAYNIPAGSIAPFTAYRINVSSAESGLVAIGELEFFLTASGGQNVARSAGTVARTITGLTSPTAAYSAAEQTTDFGGAISALVVRVYQISAAVGRGIAGEATL